MLAGVFVPIALRRWPFRTFIALLAASLLVGVAAAFCDEVVALKAELARWQAVYADADFSDVLKQLDDLAGSLSAGVSDASGSPAGTPRPDDPVNRDKATQVLPLPIQERMRAEVL